MTAAIAALLLAAKSRTEVLVDRTLGTNIGNMTGNGGLAAVFDGTTSQGFASCAQSGSGVGYVGKTHSSAKIFSRATIYGANNLGFSGSNNSCTLEIYGKNGSAPASSTDGTLIGTVTFTDTGDESAGRAITSTDTSTAYLHWWCRINTTAAIVMAEIVWYELV